MNKKKVAFKSKPATTATAEEWVRNREQPTRRLTLDIPESMHRAIKVSCASRGTKMAEDIRMLLEAHYALPRIKD